MIRKYRFRTPGDDHIELETWNKYIVNIYSPRIIFEENSIDVRHPSLDMDVSYEELYQVLGNKKKDKAADPNRIPCDFFKELTA